MTTPSFDNIFMLYYTLYRMEATTPSSSDDEYTIGLTLANEAKSRWEDYDGVYWEQLFSTAQTFSTGGVVIITSGTSSYLTPTAFKQAGGFVKIKNSNGNTVRFYPIIEAHEAQFKGDFGHYAYFTSVAGGLFTLHINPVPDTSINGMAIDYVFYRKATEFTTGTDKTECPNAEFMAHRMLCMRFMGSRNPFSSAAERRSEDMLKIMKMRNDSGSWANPWVLPDNSGAQFGAAITPGTGF